MSFGTNIGYLRKKKGMTQEEFAERMYVSRQTVSRWETDSVYPDVETVIKLCEVLECDMETLVRGDATIEKMLDELEPSLETDPAKNSKKVRFRVDITLLNAAISAIVAVLAIAACVILGIVCGAWQLGWLIVAIAVSVCALSAVVCYMLLPALFAKREKDRQEE
jgi:transcriptional regulator with XRE-family HTH domain